MDVMYTYAGGAWFRDSFNAIAAFMMSDTWDSILVIAGIISVLVTAAAYVQSHNVFHMLSWAGIFVLITILVGVKRPIQIIDTTSRTAVYQVDNVPIGLVLTSTIITSLGYAMVLAYESVFHQPDALTYTRTGMLFGADLIAQSFDFDLAADSETAGTFSDYVQNCVIGDIYLNHKYTIDSLMYSNDPVSTIFENPSPLRGIFDKNGTFRTCKETATDLRQKLTQTTSTNGNTFTYYANKIFGDQRGSSSSMVMSELMGDSYNYFYQGSSNASEIMKKNVARSAVRKGLAAYATRSGDTASLVNLSTESSLSKLRMSQATSASIATRNVPMLHTVLTGVLIGIFPIVMMLSVISIVAKDVLKGYVYGMLYLSVWPLLFAILNNAMNFYLKQTTGGMSVTMSNISTVQQSYSDIATTAGWMSWSIPILSYFIVKGMAGGMNTISSHLGSAMQGSASQAASNTVDGTWAYNNMQTDNVQGHKWDTNSSYTAGQMSRVTQSGGSVTQTGGGDTVYDSTGAMSRLPMDINASRLVSSSAQQMARESDVQAQSALSGYNNSVTSTWNTLSQFSSQRGNSDTMSNGADSSTASNQSTAAHTMRSAVESYAKANNISESEATDKLMQQSMVASAGANTRGGVEGSAGLKVLGTGASVTGYAGVHADVTGSNTDSNSKSQHGASSNDSRHDQSAQAVSDFKRGYDVLTSERVSQSGNHTDNNADSRVDQLSASLSEAKNSYQQYTSSSTRSHEYAEMASRTESMSGTMSENLNQQFANYVTQKSPENAEALLTNTSSPEIAAQREQLARSFVSEQVVPKVDADYSRNSGELGKSMAGVGTGGAEGGVRGDYAGHQNVIDGKTEQANIRSDVKDTVNQHVESSRSGVAEVEKSVVASEKDISKNQDKLQAGHASAQEKRHQNSEQANHDMHALPGGASQEEMTKRASELQNKVKNNDKK